MTWLHDMPAEKPLVMGILNVTPDSFSDGGDYLAVDAALRRVEQMVAEGVDIVDVGGESTNPTSEFVSADEELSRVVPVIEKIVANFDVKISIDTYKAMVAEESLKRGVHMVNDITALRGGAAHDDEKFVEALKNFPDVPVCIMYSKDQTARTTGEIVHYDDVMQTVRDFLAERLDYAVRAGLDRRRFIIDPGLGFFISDDHRYSLQILKRLPELAALDLPILVGPSRKSFIGKTLSDLFDTQNVTGMLDTNITADRFEGSLVSAALAVWQGAQIVRVHDVQATKRAITMATAIRDA